MTTLDPFIEKLHTLDPATPPQWGGMNAQQMVEHLAFIVKISNGKIKLQCITPPERLPKTLAFLESDSPLPRNFQAPGLEQLPPLKHASISEAIEKLKQEVQLFNKHFGQENAVEIHPVFGPLDHQQWTRFHRKHFEHHLTQFGLM